MSALLNSFAASLAAEDDNARSTQSSLAITLRPSLWSHVCSLLQPAEIDEARQLIASPYIADNAAVEEEIRALLHIAASLRRPASSPTPSTSSPSPYTAVPLLPSVFSLSQRERLKEEVAFLISALREKTGGERGSGDVSRLLSGLSPRELAIASQVEREQRLTSRSHSPSTSSRASTTRSRDSRPSSSASLSSASVSASPRRLSSRPPSSSASTSFPLSGLSSLSIFTLEKVVARLRRALVEEHAELLKDAEFLRGYIEEEEEAILLARGLAADDAPPLTPPSERELRALNERLTEAVRKEEERERTLRLLQSTPQRPAFVPGTAEHRRKASEGSTAADSVESMVAELDELEASLYLAPSSAPQPSASAERAVAREERAAEVLSLVEEDGGNRDLVSASAVIARAGAMASREMPLPVVVAERERKASTGGSGRARAGSWARAKPSPHLPSLRAS